MPTTPAYNMGVEVPKFRIYQIEEIDFGWLNECRNLVRGYLHNSNYFTKEETFNFLLDNKHNYWIVSLDDNRIAYIRSVIDYKSKVIMIGLDIHPDYQGKKYSKHIYRKFMKMMYDKYDIKSYYLRVLKFNSKAINLYLTYGFVVIEQTDIDFLMTYTYKDEYYEGLKVE